MSGTKPPPDVPSLGRTPTPQDDLKKIEGYLRQLTAHIHPQGGKLDGIDRRLRELENTVAPAVLADIKAAGIRYAEASAKMDALGRHVDAAAADMRSLAADLKRRVDEADDKAEEAAKKAMAHEATLAAIAEDKLDARLRAVEAHVAGDQRELALTRSQKAGMTAIGTAGGVIAWIVSKLFGG